MHHTGVNETGWFSPASYEYNRPSFASRGVAWPVLFSFRLSVPTISGSRTQHACLWGRPGADSVALQGTSRRLRALGSLNPATWAMRKAVPACRAIAPATPCALPWPKNRNCESHCSWFSKRRICRPGAVCLNTIEPLTCGSHLIRTPAFREWPNVFWNRSSKSGVLPFLCELLCPLCLFL